MNAAAAAPVRLVNEIGLPVRADLRLPDGAGPFPIVVIVPGFKGFKDWGMFPPTASRFAERGLATLVVNTSRCGVGEGEDRDRFVDLEGFSQNTPDREVRDVALAIGAIRSGKVDARLDAKRAGILGHSRGGGIALLSAARDPAIRGVVCWASIATFERHTGRALEEWRRTGRLEVPNLRTGQILHLDRSVLEDLEARREEYDLRRAAGAIRAPCLFLHGARDEAVDPGDSRVLHEACGAAEKRIEILEGAGHTFGAVHPWAGPTPAWERVVEASEAWFTRALAS